MIPFLDLKQQYESIKAEIDTAVIQTLESTQFVLGEQVLAFESAFARYCNTQEAVAVNSGTSALHLALAALEIGPGDEVITVPMTFVATVAAICYTGATPVFIDVDAHTFNMDASRLEAAITSRTKAIMPVHLHGQMADMSAILAIADRHGIPVIEDAAQAHGAEANGQRAGGVGKIGCFSFYPGKNLGAYGEGGAIVTNDAPLADKIRLLRDWGQDRKYNHAHVGFNARMDGIQGAVLGVKMKYIEGWTEARRAVARSYEQRLKGKGIALPVETPGNRHVYHVYSVQIDSRDDVALKMSEMGVATGIHYPVPVHMQPGYQFLGAQQGEFPISELLARNFLSLPMFPELTEEQLEIICSSLEVAVGLG